MTFTNLYLLADYVGWTEWLLWQCQTKLNKKMMVLKLHTCYTPFLRWCVKTHTHFPWSCSELLDMLLGFKELFFVSSFTSFQWRADVRIWRCVGFFIVLLQTYSNPSHTQIRSYQLRNWITVWQFSKTCACLMASFSLLFIRLSVYTALSL